MAGTKSGQTGAMGRPGETHQLKTKGPQGPPKLPDGMGTEATRVWLDAVEALSHVLLPLDYAILRGCCEAWQMFMDNKDGETKDRQQAISALSRFESLASKIGLHPHSRRIVKPVHDNEKTEDDEFHDWMSEGGIS